MKINDEKFYFVAGTNFYGGDQLWYKEQNTSSKENVNKYRTGCGSVAALNYILYLNSFLNFMDYDGTKTEYVRLGMDIYDNYVKQTISFGKNLSSGVWHIKTVAEGVKNYLAGFGLNSNYKILNSRTDSFTDAVNFIEEAISKEKPVIMLIWISPNAAKLEETRALSDFHYVTITGIEKTKDDCEFTISNWGRKVKIKSLKKIWNDKSLLFRFSNLFFGNVKLLYFDL